MIQRGNADGNKNASAVEVADRAQKAAGALVAPPLFAPTTTSSILDHSSAAQFLEKLAAQSAAGGPSYGPEAAQFLGNLASQSTTPNTVTAQFLEKLAAQSTPSNATNSGVPIPPAPPAAFGLPPVQNTFGLPPTPPVAPPIQSSLQAALGTNAVGASAIMASLSRDPRNKVKTPLSPPDSGNVSPVDESPVKKLGDWEDTVEPVSFGVNVEAPPS